MPMPMPMPTVKELLATLKRDIEADIADDEPLDVASLHHIRNIVTDTIDRLLKDSGPRPWEGAMR